MPTREFAARWNAALADAAELLLQNDALMADRARLRWQRKELLTDLVKQARTFVDAASLNEP
jgi:hypothetical protein